MDFCPFIVLLLSIFILLQLYRGFIRRVLSFAKCLFSMYLDFLLCCFNDLFLKCCYGLRKKLWNLERCPVEILEQRENRDFSYPSKYSLNYLVPLLLKELWVCQRFVNSLLCPLSRQHTSICHLLSWADQKRERHELSQ